ncbi:ArsR/SmtB family transcription factor [Rhizosaccharibacter radicis]|uniref:Metalloregulator ArsR/SmtB family transcription factor n=1 Tax=Rhizosaccharibacter radicis TaxID=2782605 RepID=A0ABT1VSH5_9PROT|nr:metalloregulator ArsR/SmtB family transcription factor [Acetobacteraceae bacterium KSS12]
MLSSDQGAGLAETFRPLGEPDRLMLVVGCLGGARSASELAEASGISQALVSHHLRLLRAARLLQARRDGKRGGTASGRSTPSRTAASATRF